MELEYLLWLLQWSMSIPYQHSEAEWASKHGGFPKWGIPILVPRVIIHVHGIFHEIFTIQRFGDPHGLGNLHCQTFQTFQTAAEYRSPKSQGDLASDAKAQSLRQVASADHDLSDPGLGTGPKSGPQIFKSKWSAISKATVGSLRTSLIFRCCISSLFTLEPVGSYTQELAKSDFCKFHGPPPIIPVQGRT